MRPALTLLLTVHVACAGLMAGADNMPDLSGQAEQALAADQPARALALTAQILGQTPDDFTALFLQSLAYSDLGQTDRALATARRAYRSGRDEGERLQAARLAAGAHFVQGNHLRAQWWLRQAANHATTTQDRDTIAREFARIRQENPLTVQANLSAAPSNNINSGAEEETFSLEGLDFEFELPPSSLPLSGIEYAGDILLSYRLSQNDRQVTSFDTYLYGRTYTLSPDAQDKVPDLSGSDYALALAEMAISHRRLIFEGLGPTGVSAHIGHVRFSGDPLWDYRKIGLSQDFPIGETARLTLQGSIQDQKARDGVQSDTTVYDIAARYATYLGNRDLLQLTVGASLNDAAFAESTFNDYRIGVDYSPDAALLRSRWTFSAGAGYTNYDEFTLSLDGRRDRYASVGATAVLQDVSYFSFSPSITVNASRRVSDVTQFTNTQIGLRIGVQSNF